MNRNDLTEVLAELEDKYPDVDWESLHAASTAQAYAPEVVADYLIDAGCDAESVKRILLDD